MTEEKARELLYAANVFFDELDEEDYDEKEDGPRQMLNMNDTWCWACAEGMVVKDSDLAEVARLFVFYGHNGLNYWYSENNGNMESEFEDIKRGVDFVRREEGLIKAMPSSSQRAYKKYKYTLGRDSFGRWWRKKKRRLFFRRIRLRSWIKSMGLAK